MIEAINAAAALTVAGKARDLPHAMILAAEAIDDGLVELALEQLIQLSNGSTAD